MISVKPFALRHALAALMAVASAATFAGGCGRQSEGERCSITNGDEDCDGSLVCTPASDLQTDDIDRCCPPAGDAISDSSCNPRVGGGNGGGSASGGANGLAGSSNLGGEGGASGLQRGESCNYTSQCGSRLVCGPGGQCQPECNTNADCPAALPVCNDRQECAATPN